MRKNKLLITNLSLLTSLGTLFPMVVSCDKNEDEPLGPDRTLTFVATGQGQLIGQTTIVVPDETKWCEFEKPQYHADDGYQLDGWFNGEKQMHDDDFILSDLTIEARFGDLAPTPASSFEWRISLGSAIITRFIGNEDCVHIPETYTDGENIYPVTSIDTGAFSDSSIRWILISNTVQTIESQAFKNCSNLYSVTIGSGVESIFSNAFDSCKQLESIHIPVSTSYISDNAFLNCNNLTTITVDPANTTYTSIDEGNECNCIIEKNTNTLSLGCKDTTIPNSVKKIGKNAFYGCTVLESITLSESLETIDEQAFYGCTGLKSITIPKNVSSIDKTSFNGCIGISSITVDPDNASFTSTDSTGVNCNCIISRQTNILFLGCGTTQIPDSVRTIGKLAFADCTTLESITIPNSVVTIDEEAFFGCTGLTSLDIPDSVQSIETCAFQKCEGLKTVNFGSGLKTIKNNAFFGCSNLESITIPDNVTYINYSSFSNCTKLKSVYIGAGTQGIGEYTFNYCPALEEIKVSTNNSLYTSNINGQECNSIFLKDGLKRSLQAGCKNSFIPDGVTSIAVNAFTGTSQLTVINIPNSVTSIDNNAFLKCDALTDITIGSGVKSIGDNAFDCGATTAKYNGSKEDWATITLGDNWKGKITTIVCNDGPIPV